MKLSATRWTIVQAAQSGDEAALRTLSTKYRPAVLSYLRRRGMRPDEAEDVAQEVFLQLFTGTLARAASDRGRFRSLLFSMSHNHLVKFVEKKTAKKRGGGEVRALGEAEVAADAPPDDVFDREWLANLLRDALGRLSREHPNYFQALRGSALEKRPQAELAEALGTSVSAIKKHVLRGRQKLAEFLREEVWGYCSTVAEFEEEMRHLARLTGGLAG